VCFIQLTGGTFTVTVTRGSGPALTGLSDLSATADAGRDTATVSYPLPIAADPSGVAAGSLGCTPGPGSEFALGDTTVTCRARDLVGNDSTAAFRVNVGRAPAPPSAPAQPVEPGGPAPEAPPAPGTPTLPAGSAAPPARAVALGGRLRVSRGVARLPVSCPAGNPAPCEGSLKLETARAIAVKAGARKRKLRLGGAGFAIAPGKQATVRLRLGRSARRALGGRGQLRLKAIATTSDPAGRPLTGARTFKVERTRR